ncbi:hypothetical protein Tco_0797439 [Tanacetum coccineum]
MTHPSPKRTMIPKAVLMRSGLVSLTTARPVNTAQPRTTVNMTGNISYLTGFKEIDGGYVTFGGNPKGGKITGRALGFMRPFGCPVTILNTIDHLGKFDGKADEGFLLGSGPNWLFDIDALTKLMNYKPVVAGNQSNSNVVQKHVMMQSSPDVGFKPSGDNEKKVTEEPGKEGGDPKVNVVSSNTSIELPNDPNMPEQEDIMYSDDY